MQESAVACTHDFSAFSCVPPYLLCYIIEYLPPEAVLSCAQVCSWWRRALIESSPVSMWRRLINRDFPSALSAGKRFGKGNKRKARDQQEAMEAILIKPRGGWELWASLKRADAQSKLCIKKCISKKEHKRELLAEEQAIYGPRVAEIIKLAIPEAWKWAQGFQHPDNQISCVHDILTFYTVDLQQRIRRRIEVAKPWSLSHPALLNPKYKLIGATCTTCAVSLETSAAHWAFLVATFIRFPIDTWDRDQCHYFLSGKQRCFRVKQTKH